MKLSACLILIFLATSKFCFSQDKHVVDSLQNLLIQSKDDSSKADLLYSLCRIYATSNPETCIVFAQQCYTLSENIGYKKGMGNANNAHGYALMQAGNYSAAVEQLKKALSIRLTLGDPQGSIKTYKNLIASYKKLNNDDEVIRSYLAVLPLQEKIGDVNGIIEGFTNLGEMYNNQANYTQALHYYTELLKIKNDIGDQSGIADTYNDLGVTYENQKNYPEALMNHLKALHIKEELQDKNGIAYSHYNIGYINEQQGNYVEGLKHYFTALKYMEEINNQEGIATIYMGIGTIYQAQGNYPDALKNLTTSLKIREDLHDPSKIAETHNAIGIVYDNLNNFPEALKNYTHALNINKEINYKKGIAGAYNNIGELYKNQEHFSEALKNLSQSLRLHQEDGDKNGMAACYINMGAIALKEKRYNDASQFLTSALSLSKETENIPYLYQVYDNLTSLDSAQGKYDQALAHFKLSVLYQDSMINIRNAKQIVQQQMQYDFDKKEALTKAEQEKKEALAKEVFEREQDSLKFENAKRELFLQKEMQLKSITYEYQMKQAKAKSEKERQQLRFEEELKRKQVAYDFQQKQLAIETEFKRKQAAQKAQQEKKDALARQEIEQQKIVRNGLLGVLALVLVFAGVFFTQRNKIKKGKKQSDALLLNILPYDVAEELKLKGSSAARDYDMATIMFTDFKDFTKIGGSLSPSELLEEMNFCFSAFDEIIERHGVEKIKTIGDAYMCVGGVPIKNQTHAEDTVMAAIEIIEFIDTHNKNKIAKGETPLGIRIGINSGPIVAGIVGVKKFAYDIWGDAVNIASRMESNGEVGKVNISGTTLELVKDKVVWEHRGKIHAKNKGEIDMYFVSKKGSTIA